jgi:hypothetical protein
VGAEGGGWCEQHGPFTALGQRKLQAGIWCRGYAVRELGTPRRFDSITGALEYWIIRFRG